MDGLSYCYIAIFLVIGRCSNSITCWSTSQPTFKSLDERDTDDSRKVLGSSVVTSVSVITNRGNETNQFFTNAIENPELKTNTISSPGNFLSPDKYEFYTFDEAGDLVKRLMTWDEIQGLIAGSDTDGILGDTAVPIYYSENVPAGTSEAIRLIENDFHTSNVQDIRKVIQNVQNVLKNELAASQSKILPVNNPTSLSSEPSNWSLYLPTLWENMEDSEIEELHNLPHTPTSMATSVHDHLLQASHSPHDVSSFSISPFTKLNYNESVTSASKNKDDAKKTEKPLRMKTTTNKPYFTPDWNKYPSNGTHVKIAGLHTMPLASGEKIIEKVSASTKSPSSTYQVPTASAPSVIPNGNSSTPRYGLYTTNHALYTAITNLMNQINEHQTKGAHGADASLLSLQTTPSTYKNKYSNYTQSSPSLSSSETSIEKTNFNNQYSPNLNGNNKNDNITDGKENFLRFPSTNYFANKQDKTKPTSQLFQITTQIPPLYEQLFSVNKTTTKTTPSYNIAASSATTSSSLVIRTSSSKPTQYESTNAISTPVTGAVTASPFGVSPNTVASRLTTFEELTTTRPEPLVTWIATYPFDQIEEKISNNNDISDSEKLVTEQYVSGTKTKPLFYTKNNTAFSLLPSYLEQTHASEVSTNAVTDVNANQHFQKINKNTSTLANIKSSATTSDSHGIPTVEANNFLETTTTTTTSQQFANLDKYLTPSTNRFRSTSTTTANGIIPNHVSPNSNVAAFENTTTSSENTMQRVPTIDPPNKAAAINHHNDSFDENELTILSKNSSPHYATSTEAAKNLTQIAIMVNKSHDTTKIPNKIIEIKQNKFTVKPNINAAATSNHVSTERDKDNSQAMKPINATTFLNDCIASFITSSANDGIDGINRINDNGNGILQGNGNNNSADNQTNVSSFPDDKHRTESENTSTFFQKVVSPDKQKENSHIYYYKLPPISPQLLSQNQTVSVNNLSQSNRNDYKPSTSSTNHNGEVTPSTHSSSFFGYYNNKFGETALNTHRTKPPAHTQMNETEYQKITTVEHPQKISTRIIITTTTTTSPISDDNQVATAANEINAGSVKVTNIIPQQTDAMRNGISAITNYLLPVEERVSNTQLVQNLALPEKSTYNRLQNKEATSQSGGTNMLLFDDDSSNDFAKLQLIENVNEKFNVDSSDGNRRVATVANSIQPTEANNKKFHLYQPLSTNTESISRLNVNKTTPIKELVITTKIVDTNDQQGYNDSTTTIVSTTATATASTVDSNTATMALGHEYPSDMMKRTQVGSVNRFSGQENITVPFASLYQSTAGSIIESQYRNEFTTLQNKVAQNSEQQNIATQETQNIRYASDHRQHGNISAAIASTIKPISTSVNSLSHVKPNDSMLAYRERYKFNTANRNQTQNLNKNQLNSNNDRTTSNVTSELSAANASIKVDDADAPSNRMNITITSTTATVSDLTGTGTGTGRLPINNFNSTTPTTITSFSFNSSRPMSNNGSTNLRNDMHYVEIKLENNTHGHSVANDITTQKYEKFKTDANKPQKQSPPNTNSTTSSLISGAFRSPSNSPNRSPTSAPNLAVELHPAPYENMGLEASTAYLGDDVKTFIDLCNEFSFKIWTTQTGKSLATSRSIVLSPFATLSTLAMIFLGARGSTSGVMNDFLRLDDMVTFNPHQVLRNITESVLNSKNNGIANVAFVREIFSDKAKGNVLEFYRERLQQYYDTHIEEIHFNVVGDLVRRRTNLLVKKQTQGRIQDFLKGSALILRPPLAAFTTNIFQTNCSIASTDGRDGEMYFVVRPSTRQRRLIPIPAVVYRGGFLAGYEAGLDATAVTLSPESTISTVLVLPGQQGQVAPGDGLARLEQRLLESSYRRGAWSRLLRSLLFRHGLEVQLPRFSHKSILNLTLGLQKIGMGEIFSSDKADLRGINGLLNELHLSDMIQVNMFSLCGEDTIDARHHVETFPSSPQRTGRMRRSDSELSNTYHALPLNLRPRQARLPDNPRLRFDRPFLYVVRHNPTGMILYIGRFNPRLLP